jgi:hypothetical protein
MSEASKQRALNEIHETLAKLPQGASRPQMEEVQATILRRHQAAHRRAEAKRGLIETGLKQIYPELLRMEREWQFDQSILQVEEEIRPMIRSALEQEIDGGESREEVARLVGRFVWREVKIAER